MTTLAIAADRQHRLARRASMRGFSCSVITMTMLFSLFSGDTPIAQAGAPDDLFYVSLGDSLAAGYQPSGERRMGYVDDLWRSVRDAIPALRRRRLACPGETTRSMITGTGSPCSYDEGSQLDAAVSFLNGHSGGVPFITVDIGSNDVFDRCLDFRTGVLDRACVVDLLPRLRARVTNIVDALRTAAGPDVPILGMTYYDPLLGFWGTVPHGHEIARMDERAWEVFDDGLTSAYEDAGAVVADVATTFRIDDFRHTVFVHGRGRLPVNVALTCRWTWFCSPTYFGDPHANTTGYRKIARTFLRKLRPLLA
jgi:hypothetical protein